jgi:CRP-like cAMP-binding protein
VKRRVSFAAQDNVIREADAGGQVRILLSGTTCSYKREEDGGRSILSFQHAGDFCDLHRYVLPDLEPAMGVQALTDCTVGVIDYRDVDRLLSRPTLASAFWRASMLEAAAYRERFSSIGRGTALERVAHLLCEQWHAAKRLASVVLGCRSHRSMSLTPQAFPSCMSIERSRHCGL